MRGSQVERLCKRYLGRVLPGFACRKTLLIDEPASLLLRGFLFESSGLTAQAFYVRAFVQPLYVPRNHVVLTHSIRLGGGSHFWEVDQQSEAEVMSDVLLRIRSDGLSFLDARREPIAFAATAARRQDSWGDPALLEAIIYSKFLGDDVDRLPRYISRFYDVAADADEWRKGLGAEIPTAERQAIERVQEFEAALKEGAPVARRLLMKWRDYTATRLGVRTDTQ